MIATEIITTLPALEAIRPGWEGLWKRSPGATPFQSPAWLLPWAARWARETLWALAARRAGELVGLLPGFIAPAPSGIYEVHLLGEGIGDYLDGLAEPGCGAAVLSAWRERLRAEGLGHCWRQLHDDALLRRMPVDEIGGDVQEFPDVPCPVVKLGSDDVPPGVSRDFARSLAYDRRRLERRGDVCIQNVDTESLPGFLSALRRLHGMRWGSRGESGVLADPVVANFHEAAAPGLLEGGVLRAAELRIAGATVACYHGFIYDRRAYYYIGGFDPAFERYGVGNRLIAHALAAARAAGAVSFDFLRGQERYKYRWGAQDTPTWQRRGTL